MALSSSRARAAEPFWPERARALPRGPFSEAPAAETQCMRLKMKIQGP